MPKKIKKVKETVLKGNKKKIITTKNIHFIFIAIFVLIVGVCVGVGLYKHSKDEYHVHKDQAFVKFIYSESVHDGYNVYEVKQFENKDIYASISTPTSTKDKKWGDMKFLDFNEEIYATNILENQSMEKEYDNNAVWTLEFEFADGQVKYYSSNGADYSGTELANIILKYFGEEILFN